MMMFFVKTVEERLLEILTSRGYTGENEADTPAFIQVSQRQLFMVR
jgi:hypothetical protein